MRTAMKLLVVLMGALIVGLILLMPSLGMIARLATTQEIVINNQTIVASVVSKTDDRARGLGGRDHLAINEGMLFLFEDQELYGFWMKDMKFPIDILWLKGNRIVGITENIDPQIGAPESELKVYYPPEPVARVLEIAAGRARLLHARVGDPVTIRGLAGTD